jgi:serine/threonine-protein kinase HipA
MTVASVHLWGKRIGAVLWQADVQLGRFEYDPSFVSSGIELAPLMMPLAARDYAFPALNRDTFHGLPGMLADVLPDRYGNALIDAWLVSQGRNPGSFNPVERLCYTGSRGIGALEFQPTLEQADRSSSTLNVAALVDLAGRILSDRKAFATSFHEGAEGKAMREILRVGTSAGGARAKAVIAWNPETGEVRCGDAEQKQGFSHWLLKFDGVTNNRDRELTMPKGYGKIEYAYHKMAVAAGIEMMECRLLHENDRSHFVTKRFDRNEQGQKLHQQSLCAIAHFDFNMAGAYSYEQALWVMRQLHLPMASLEQQFRRAVFNVLARNQDDHVKNIAFLMEKNGEWSLSPAFDVTYNYNPEGMWTNSHQMILNNKRRGFTRSDFAACAETLSMRRGRAEEIVEEVRVAVAAWLSFAADAGVETNTAEQIARAHRLEMPA